MSGACHLSRYLVPALSPVRVKILFPSRMRAFSQGVEWECCLLPSRYMCSSTYIRLPPVIPGNWTWTVVGVICRKLRLPPGGVGGLGKEAEEARVVVLSVVVVEVVGDGCEIGKTIGSEK